MNKKQKKKKGDELTCMNELLSKSARQYLLHNIRSKTNGFFFYQKKEKKQVYTNIRGKPPPSQKKKERKKIKKRAYTQIERKKGRWTNE